MVEDLGAPIAYTVLDEGTPVYDRNGERIGGVDHVLADMQLDIFEGVVVHTLPLPGPAEDGTPENPLEARLRRAWDWISGRR